MGRRSLHFFRIASLTPILFALCLPVNAQQAVSSSALEAGFQSPPQSAHPSTWWHWINGNVSREGILADLQDMKRVGIAGVQAIDVSMYSPQGSAHYHSEEWYADMQYAIHTANQLGLTFGIANGPGWSGSGGPWVTPELAMKHVVWSETTVQGGDVVRASLPQPASRLGFYRDIAVLAVPADTPDTETGTVETSPADLFARDREISKPSSDVAASTVTIRYLQPVERRTLEIHPAHGGVSGSFAGQIESSTDGESFHLLRSFNLHGQLSDPSLVLSFPPAVAKVFRIRFNGGVSHLPQLSAVTLSNSARIENFRSKSADAVVAPVLASDSSLAVDPAAVPLDKIIKLSASMSPDGSLVWNAPPGRWTILRFGYTSTGATVHPPQTEGAGLEIDKMDAAATDFHFEHSLGRIIREAGPLAGTTFKQIMIDSWESGQQNWTAALPAFFQAHRGYSLEQYLPALAGRVVVSPAASEAFLRDYRRTLSEMVAENYYGEFRRLARQHNMDLYAEAYPGTMFNEAEAAAKSDVPMSEFWVPGGTTENLSVKRVASVAHTAGKDLVAAEAFTGSPETAGWLWTPATLKPVGDIAFASGLTQAFLHTYVHQPRSDIMPGWTMGRYGTHFGRLNPWWAQAKPWLDYMARCQFLLQQGTPVSDVLVLNTEDIDGLQDSPVPPVPASFDYDWVTPSQIVEASATGYGIQLAHAGTYRALVLPSIWTADISLLKQLKRIVDSGTPVFGPRPIAPSSMPELMHPAAWQGLVDLLWQAKEVHADSSHIVNPLSSLGQLLALHVAPDVSFTMHGKDAAPLWIHRRTSEGDLYFLANPGNASLSFSAAFRSGSRRPELWDAVTGIHADAAPFETTEQGIRLPLTLGPGGSIFVVFRVPLPARWLQSVTAQTSASTVLPAFSAQQLSPSLRFTRPGDYLFTWSDGVKQPQHIELPPSAAINGDWAVHFQPPVAAGFDRKFATLHDLSQDADTAVRYFAGTATYTKKITLTAQQLGGNGCLLELGDVHDIATVRVNGSEVAVVWTSPYEADISRWLIAGDNTVEIAVIDRWVNRLIGDEHLPPDATYASDASEFTRGRLAAFPSWYGDPVKTAKRERTTFASWQHYTSNSALVPSGLMGLVSLRFYRQMTLPEAAKVP